MDINNERRYGDSVTNPINVWPEKIVESNSLWVLLETRSDNE